MRPEPLPEDFYARGAAKVARDLLGRLLVSRIGDQSCVARIVETEAYTGPRDPASHSAAWHRSARNQVMYGPPGRAYVYFTYGMHWCFNVVTGRSGYPAAVLVRAAHPLDGLEVMRRRRGVGAERMLTSGPARLTQALGITGEHDGHPLFRAPLWIAAGEPVPRGRCRITARVGITRAVERRLRFFERGSRFVSGKPLEKLEKLESR